MKTKRKKCCYCLHVIRSADEMKPLDSPFQSRKDRDSVERDEDEPVEASKSFLFFKSGQVKQL
jgi:hypothetical protein